MARAAAIASRLSTLTCCPAQSNAASISALEKPARESGKSRAGTGRTQRKTTVSEVGTS